MYTNQKIQAVEIALKKTKEYEKQLTYLAYTGINYYDMIKQLKIIEGTLKKIRDEEIAEIQRKIIENANKVLNARTHHQ